MRNSKTLRDNGQPKGAWIYGIRNNGEKFTKPTFFEYVGLEQSPEDVVKRLKFYNNREYVIAENQDELNIRYSYL